MAKKTIHLTLNLTDFFFQSTRFIRIFSFNFCCSKKWANFPLRVRHTRFRFKCFQSTAPFNTNWRYSRREQRFYTLNSSRTVQSEHLMQNAATSLTVKKRRKLNFPMARTRCWRLCWCSKMRFSQRGKSGVAFARSFCLRPLHWRCVAATNAAKIHHLIIYLW